MRKGLLHGVACLILTLFATVPIVQATEEPATETVAVENSYSVAVLPFTASGKKLQEMANEVPLLLSAFMSANGQLLMVERADVEKAMDEVALGMSGTVDPATAAKVGHLLGAQVLITGRIFTVQRELFVVAKIIGVETGRVYGQTATLPLEGSIGTAAQELSDKLANDITRKGNTLVAQKVAKEDIVAALRDVVKEKQLPTVTMTIPEMSLNRVVPDPAAEAELGFILQSLGFTLIDPAASNETPDVEISGEAFSEFGMRKGQLVSSRARVELKAIDRKTGRVLLMDRETASAVDIAVEVSGKSAIAKATAALAKRLVPALVAEK